MPTVICPECRKQVTISDTSHKFSICPHCGAQVRISIVANPPAQPNLYPTEHDHPDENSLSRTVLRFCKNHPKEVLIALALCMILCVVSVSCMSHQVEKNAELYEHQQELAALEDERTVYSHMALNEAQIPKIKGLRHVDEYLYMERIDYRIVTRAFEDAGFINVIENPHHDKYSYHDKVVYEITVDGLPQLPSGEWYPIDTPIVISYYTCD